MGDFTKILHGKATVEISSDGGSNWADAGFQTEDGAGYTYTPKFNKESVQERDAPVLNLKESEECTLTVNIKESDIDRLHQAIGASIKVGDVLHVGSQPGREVMVRLTGMGTNGKLMRYTFFRCSPEGAVGQMFVKAKARIIPITYQVLADTTKDPASEGDLFTVEEIAA